MDDAGEMIGVEAGKHTATLGAVQVGVLHSSKSYVLQDDDGQIFEAHSVSAGLDYPGLGPEHALLKDLGRLRYVAINDGQALSAFRDLCRWEGIIQDVPSPTVFLSAEPQTIILGQAATLKWSCSEAETCVIEPDIGVVDTNGSIFPESRRIRSLPPPMAKRTPIRSKPRIRTRTHWSTAS